MLRVNLGDVDRPYIRTVTAIASQLTTTEYTHTHTVNGYNYILVYIEYIVYAIKQLVVAANDMHEHNNVVENTINT